MKKRYKTASTRQVYTVRIDKNGREWWAKEGGEEYQTPIGTLARQISFGNLIPID
jgi:uncharacterized protein (DUF4415 family)